MKTRTLLLASLLLAGALAGCANQPATEPTPTTTASPTPATSTPATPTSATPVVDPTPTIDTIRVGTDAAYPPFEDKRGDAYVGFDMEIIREIGNRSGFTVEIQNAIFDTIIPSVQAGTLDVGVSAFSITDARREQVDFSVPYYDNILMAAVEPSETGVDAPEDLVGKKVCTQRSTTSEGYLRDELGFTDADLVLLDTAPPCRDAIVSGNADALLIDAAFVRALIRDSEGTLKQAFTVDPEEQFGIVIKKGNTPLLVAINTALNSMKADGTLDELKDKWQV